MKKLSAVIILLTFLILSSFVHAHEQRKSPFFKVNGLIADLYPVPMTSLSIITLPKGLGPQNYLVNEAVEFEIDPAQLPMSKKIAEQTKLTWNFGDGIVAEGLKNKHSFSKPGSYRLTIYTSSGEGGKPQLLYSIQLNIVPDEKYSLPKAVIFVDGQTTNDPVEEVLETSFDKQLKFDGTKSQSLSKITEYSWDFADQQTASGPTVTHKYASGLDAVFPVLVIKTADGFMAASFIQIQEKDGLQNPSDTKTQDISRNIIVVAGALLALSLGIFLLRKIKSKK